MNISGVGEMGVGETGVGEMGQIIGETGVGEMGVGEMGVGETGTSLREYHFYAYAFTLGKLLRGERWVNGLKANVFGNILSQDLFATAHGEIRKCMYWHIQSNLS